jgi:hypothetical protein
MTGLAQRPIPAHGASVAVREERGHHVRMCPGRRSGTLAVGAAVASWRCGIHQRLEQGLQVA